MNVYRHSIILFFFSVISCGPKTPDTEELKQKFGDFAGGTIKMLPVDYTQTPINKKIDHHPEDFTFLNEVDIYSMAHLSDGNFVTGFVVKPKTPGNYPCIILNRGGNRELGRLLVATAVEVMAPLAAKGYIVAATNYRGNSGSEGKEEFGGADVNDVLNLINSMSEIESADTSRVGLLGISRGGMMNYLTLKQTKNSNIKTAASIGGITDLGLTIEHHREIGHVADELIPGYKDHILESNIERSANYWVYDLPASVPLLIMHSKMDDHVYYSQALTFADSLEHYGIPYSLMSFENDKHGLVEHKDLVFNTTVTWFNRYVRDGVSFEEVNKRTNY